MCIIIHSGPTPVKSMPIKEDLLHYIWRIKSLNLKNLCTTDGEALNIISFGNYNHSDGPDFLEAQIELSGTKWIGSIEMHVKSSDWNIHGHSSDSNYQNTILHVVYKEDKEIKRKNGTKIPCLVLKGRMNTGIIQLYQKFDSALWIPCESLIDQSSELSQTLAKERALSDRLEKRWKGVNISNNLTNNDWEETAYRLICRSFGLVHNADAFLQIAMNIPYSILKKNSNNLESLEAIYMGTAGLLTSDLEDEYSQRIKNDYQFYRKKYDIQKIDISLKHKAVRPPNFPEVALSQFINLMSKPRIFSQLLEANIQGIEKLLNVKASPYWDNHYTFDKISNTKIKTLGKSKMRGIIINAIVPMLYFMSKKTGDDNWSKKALDLLEQIPAEKNNIISRWESLNIRSNSAYDTQALLELKKHHCNKKKCLSCPIGHNILKPNG